MKIAMLALPFALLSMPAFAQDAAAHANHAGHAAGAATDAKLSVGLPIEALMANPAAKAVVDANMPGIEAHPAYGQFKAMSLRDVMPFSNGMITAELLAKIDAELAAIK